MLYDIWICTPSAFWSFLRYTVYKKLAYKKSRLLKKFRKFNTGFLRPRKVNKLMYI